MSVTYTVYCTQPVDDLTPEQLAEGVLSTDLRAAGESEGVRPGWVESASRALVVENTDVAGFARFRMCYLPDAAEPIDVAQWPAGLEMHRALIVDLEDQNHPSRRRIAAYLNRSVAVVEISFDCSPRAMALVLARAAAVCVATWFGGMVREPGDTWWRVSSKTGYGQLPADPPDPSNPQPATPVLRYARPGAAQSPPQGVIERHLTQPPQGRRVRTWRTPPPSDCPACGLPLRGHFQSKKGPGLSIPAWCVMLLGVLVSATVYLVAAVLFREYTYDYMPARSGGLFALVWFPVALVPGLGIAMIATRFPKVLRLQCRKCGWRERFTWG